MSNVGMASSSPALFSAEGSPSFSGGSDTLGASGENFHKLPATAEAATGAGKPRDSRERAARGQIEPRAGPNLEEPGGNFYRAGEPKSKGAYRTTSCGAAEPESTGRFGRAGLVRPCRGARPSLDLRGDL